jgi:hypothetical protein
MKLTPMMTIQISRRPKTSFKCIKNSHISPISSGGFDLTRSALSTRTSRVFKSKVPAIRKSFDNWLENEPKVSESDKNMSETLCTLYERVASKLSDHDYGIFPLTHGDLGTHNVLFIRDQSGQLRINAVLDWDYAHASAWPDFGQFPTMLEIDWPTLETGEYSSFALNNLRHQQKLYLDGIGKCQDPSPADGFPVLSNIIDTPAVRVAEFILSYSNPKENLDVAMFLKFIRDWRSDWEI